MVGKFIQIILKAVPMEYQITHVRVSDHNSTSSEKITHVRISGGYPDYTVDEIIKFMNNNHTFFYTDYFTLMQKAFIEVVRPSSGTPYIRTKANTTIKDNLLSLPRF